MNNFEKLHKQELKREYDRNRHFFKEGLGRDWVSYDALIEENQEPDSEPSWVSDGGAGVKRMLNTIEPPKEVPPTWLRLYREVYSQLPPTGQRVLNALEQDWRTRPAARIAGVSQPTVDKWKRRFRQLLAASFAALTQQSTDRTSCRLRAEEDSRPLAVE